MVVTDDRVLTDRFLIVLNSVEECDPGWDADESGIGQSPAVQRRFGSCGGSDPIPAADVA